MDVIYVLVSDYLTPDTRHLTCKMQDAGCKLFSYSAIPTCMYMSQSQSQSQSQPQPQSQSQSQYAYNTTYNWCRLHSYQGWVATTLINVWHLLAITSTFVFVFICI